MIGAIAFFIPHGFNLADEKIIEFLQLVLLYIIPKNFQIDEAYDNLHHR